jgi:hypothetical protein
MCVCICMCVCVCLCVCIYVCMCVDICVCVYVFIQDPDPESDPGSDPKLCEKSDPDPKKSFRIHNTVRMPTKNKFFVLFSCFAYYFL